MRRGAFKVTFRVPRDFGGLHDIFAVVDGKQVAKGGFLLERTVKISPTRGPVGTPITVTVVGMGSPTYESVGRRPLRQQVRGCDLREHDPGHRRVQDPRLRRASAAHWIEFAGSSHTVPYLNMEQSPVPWTDGHRLQFRVTKDEGAPKPFARAAEGRDGRPSTERTTLSEREPRGIGGERTARLDQRADPRRRRRHAAGLTAERARTSLQWASVVGNRVNCTGSAGTSSTSRSATAPPAPTGR